MAYVVHLNYSLILKFLVISLTQQNGTSAPHAPQHASPCPTLFVANLGPTCTEQELIQVFSRFVGISISDNSMSNLGHLH